MLAYREPTSTRSRSGALGCIASKLCKCMQAQTSVLSSSSFALTRRTVYVGTYVYECAGCQRGGKPLISGNSDNLDAYAIITKKTERRRQLTGASANHPFLLLCTIPFRLLFLSKITPTILFPSVSFVQFDSPNHQHPCYSQTSCAINFTLNKFDGSIPIVRSVSTKIVPEIMQKNTFSRKIVFE